MAKNTDTNKDKKSILQMDVKDIFNKDFLRSDVSPKTLIVIILGVVGLIAYGYFGIYPKYIQYKNSELRVANAQKELNGYQEKLDEMPILQEKLRSLTDEANEKSKSLSHDMEDGLFLIGLDKTVRSLGINLKDYTIQNIVNYPDFYAIPMSINVEGDYRKVRDLISYLEEQENVTQVMDYSMVAKKTEEKKEINKRVYWTRQDKHYHLDKTCQDMVPGDVLYGTASQSGGRTPDPKCVGNASNTVEVEVISKAKGDISANIQFIVYSSDKDMLKLKTDQPQNWKPGKYNPFQDTVN